MSSITFNISFPIVHVAIDIQSRYFDVGDPFPATARNFADGLSIRGIPTVWVALTNALKHGSFKKEIPHGTYCDFGSDKDPQFVTRLGLSEVSPTYTEAIFVKNFSNAFERNLLAHILKQKRTEAIIISGLKSTDCVANSVAGALRNDFTVIIVSDLLQGPRYVSYKEDVLQSSALEKVSPDSKTKLLFASMQEILNTFEAKLMPPRSSIQLSPLKMATLAF
ncbi:MAG: cysteine hydrolase family protein [Bdellovibrionales bacterium]